MKAFKKNLTASVIKRPHLGASQRKYVYEVTVGELTFAPTCSPTGPVCILWTRGSKTAITSEHKLGATRSITFDQPISLICTLFLDAGSFAEKLCTFAVIEQGSRGAHTVGKCKVDMAPYADVQSSATKPLTLTLRKGAVAVSDHALMPRQPHTGAASTRHNPVLAQVATVRLSIASRWLKDYQIDDDAETISSVGTDDLGDSSSRYDDLNPDDWPEEPSPPPPGQAPASTPPPAVTPTTPELSAAAATPPAATPASASADPAPPRASAASTCAASAAASPVTTARPDAAATPAAEAPAIRKLNLVAAGSAAAATAASQADAPQPTQLPPPAATDASGLMVLSTAKAATISGRSSSSSSAAATGGGAATLGGAAGGLPVMSTARAATCGAGGVSSAFATGAAAGSPQAPERMLDLAALADVRVVGGPGGRRATVSGVPTAAAAGGVRLDSPARATFSSSTLGGFGGAAGLGGAVQARAEAERKEMEAQLSAATALKNKMHARYEEAQQDFEKERAQLRESVAQLQQQLVATEGRERQTAQTAQTATAQLHEARAEAKRLRQEKDEAALDASAGVDDDDTLAIEAARQDLQSKLDRSEQHREEVARKLGKARKHQQNQLAQYEAEIGMLAEKVELMEDEIGDEIQARLELQTQLEQEQKKVEGMAAELQDARDRQARRAHILPEGVQELHDQIEMAHSVRATLCNDIAKLTEELVEAKLLAAQESERSETLEGKLRRAGDKQRMLSVRMTELEMLVEDGKNQGADTEEHIAEAFKEVMQEQELKILRLEEQLHEARTAKPAAASGSTGSTPRSEGKSRFGLPKLG